MPHPDQRTSTVITQSTKKKRIAAIQAALARSADKVDYFSGVGLRVAGPRPPKAAIDIAVNSANKKLQSKTGKWLKRHFLEGQFRWCYEYLRRRPDATLIVWNGIKGHRGLFARAARMLGRKVIYLEEAPFAGRITVDSVGVNYGSSLPRSIGFYETWAKSMPISPDEWRLVGQTMTSRKAAARTDVQQDPASDALSQEKFIFCPLQVPGDSQITIYGDWINSVETFIDVVAKASQTLPDGWHIRIKEHPTSSVSFSEKLAAVSGARLRVDNRTDTMQQVALSQGVLTINSSVGLQAFFYDKPVLVLGHAFYAFDVMAIKVDDAATLGRLLSDPSKLDFNSKHRNVFMNYLDQAYYPTEQDVLSGHFDLPALARRDAQKDALLAQIMNVTENRPSHKLPE